MSMLMLPVVGDCREALKGHSRNLPKPLCGPGLEKRIIPTWLDEIGEWKKASPLVGEAGEKIKPQQVIEACAT